jgi:allantoinase
MLPMHLTPYIMGLPYRIGALEGLLATLATRPESWFATGGEIVTAWEGQP